MLRRITDLCFLKMPVNAVQYRVTVGIFNNRKLIINLNLRFELPSCSKLSNNLPNYYANYVLLLFYIFLIAFLFSKVMFQKLAQNYIYFIFPVVQFSYGCACVALQWLNNT